MAKDTAAVHSQEDTHSEKLHQVVMSDLMSTSDIATDDTESNIDRIFSELFESASRGTVEQAGLHALDDVRDKWMFIQRDVDELTRTGFYMQLIDRVLHSASIYDLGTHLHRALAVRAVIFNLNLDLDPDGSTPVNLKVCTGTSSV
jgi:hypothetical protein